MSSPDFEARCRSSFEKQRFMSTLGARLVAIRPGEAVIELPFGDHLTQQHGFLHAGAVTSIVETGVGKTFIAQVTGLHACACGKSVMYMTVTTWLENVALARSSGTYLRYRDKLAKPDVLIFDDMGMRKMSSIEAQDLCEILEERSIAKSTIFTTQLPLDHWSEVIADPVIADAIRDRLQHSALTINIIGESYRGVKARKLASKKKDA